MFWKPFFPFVSIFSFCYAKKWGGQGPPGTPWCRRPCTWSLFWKNKINVFWMFCFVFCKSFHQNVMFLLIFFVIFMIKIREKGPIMWETFLALAAVVRRCSVKKVFLNISQNTQENACVSRDSFLIKLQTWSLKLHLKRDSGFFKIFENTFFIEHLRWLLLKLFIVYIANL